MKHGIAVHGGVGSPRQYCDGCRRAAEAGMAALRSGKSSAEAVVAAVVLLEDDGRFNAGSGSVLRLDGSTIEMDAAVMDSEGLLGAVAAVSGVKNPVLLAAGVARGPHALMAGAGACELARRLGLERHPGPTHRALEQYRKILDTMRRGQLDRSGQDWGREAVERYWNFPSDPPGLGPDGDTVGAVAMDAAGRFAVATSTGGASPMLRGRVGDAPLAGCGFYAGSSGAVAATGLGEQIMRRVASMRVYQEIERGAGAVEACRRGVSLFPREVDAGFIALGRGGCGEAANRDMAWHSLQE